MCQVGPSFGMKPGRYERGGSDKRCGRPWKTDGRTPPTFWIPTAPLIAAVLFDCELLSLHDYFSINGQKRAGFMDDHAQYSQSPDLQLLSHPKFGWRAVKRRRSYLSRIKLPVFPLSCIISDLYLHAFRRILSLRDRAWQPWEVPPIYLMHCLSISLVPCHCPLQLYPTCLFL